MFPGTNIWHSWLIMSWSYWCETRKLCARTMDVMLRTHCSVVTECCNLNFHGLRVMSVWVVSCIWLFSKLNLLFRVFHKIAEIGNKWQYWYHRLYYVKTKNPSTRCYPSEHWTRDLNHLDLILSELSKHVLLRRSLLVLTKWS